MARRLPDLKPLELKDKVNSEDMQRVIMLVKIFRVIAKSMNHFQHVNFLDCFFSF